jgi:c-di-GMP-related signal transduction protein
MCELVAHTVNGSMADAAFATGMLSCFGLLLGMPLGTIVESLRLNGELRTAVLTGAGPLGRLVADVSDHLLGRPADTIRTGFSEAVSVAALEALG